MDNPDPHKSPKADRPPTDVSMRPRDLVLAGLAQIVGLAVAAGVIIGFRIGEPILAQVVGAVLGTEVAAWRYHSRHRDPAPANVKAVTGAILAVLCILMGTLIQVASGWMTYPEIVIPIDAVGTFVFPFVLFGTMQKALAKGKKTDIT